MAKSSIVSPSPEKAPVVVPPGAYQKLISAAKPKVALVGFCEGSRNWTPYLDPEFEIWGLNNGRVFQPVAHRWFDMHGAHIYRWELRRPHKHLEFLKSFPGPVYMHDYDPEIPTTVTYPLQEVAEYLGVNIWRTEPGKDLVQATGDPYLPSTISYQLALALYEGFREVHLYGIDLNTGGEYAWQKAGVEFLLGFAAASGVKVVLPENCPLLRGNLYGRGFKKPEGEKVSKSQYEVRLKELQERLAKVTAKYHQVSGAKAESDWIIAQMPPGINAEHLAKRNKELVAGMLQLEAEARQLEGMIKEISYWISMTPDGQPGKQAIEQLLAAAGPHDVMAEPGTNGHGPEDAGGAMELVVAGMASAA